jgi:hypothetical protein
MEIVAHILVDIKVFLGFLRKIGNFLGAVKKAVRTSAVKNSFTFKWLQSKMGVASKGKGRLK